MSQVILCEFVCEPTSMRRMCRRCGTIIQHYQVIEAGGVPRMACANQDDGRRPEFSGQPCRDFVKYGSITGRHTMAEPKTSADRFSRIAPPNERTNELIGQEGGRFDKLYLEEV